MGCKTGDDIGPGRNGRRPGEPILAWPGSSTSALGLVPTPPANDGHPILGPTRGPPLTRWTTYTRPGLHIALGIGNDVQRGQNEGLVAVN